MFRHIARPLATTAPRSIIAPAPAPAPRSFSALAPKMAEGDTGAPKQGGAAQGYVSFPLDMCSVQCAVGELTRTVTPLPSAKQPRRISTSMRRKWKSMSSQYPGFSAVCLD